MRVSTFLIILLSVIGFSCKKSHSEKKDLKDKAGVLKERISEFWEKNDSLNTDSIRIDAFLKEKPEFEPYRKKMYKFYSRRDYELAWSEKGEFLPQASMFINMLRNVHKEGLDPEKFNVTSLEELYNRSNEKFQSGKKKRKSIHDLDLALTASYFMYSRELWKGIVHPGEENLEWHVNRKKIKFGKTLDSILSADKSENPFREYEPLHREYHDLKNSMERYRKIAETGGWETLSYSAILQPGDTSEAVIMLRKRLFSEGYPAGNLNDSVYTKDLSESVKMYQDLHGLKKDGIYGPDTRENLNIPVEERIRQMEINLERWRWVPDKIEKDYIMVNIPEFRLRVYEREKEVMSMKVIVGKDMTTTPVFNDRLEYIVLNPYWNVPASIATGEIIPALKKDPGYLDSQNMEVYLNYDYDHPLNPYAINWDVVDPGNSPYQFRQNPGPGNALGSIKFLFPNTYNVYLHDTPQRYLFERDERRFSHGCIRIEKPIELAEYILRNSNAWPADRIRNTIGGANTWIKLTEKEHIPVYILYFTVWVDDKGRVHFLEDIYGHDRKLEKAYFEEKAS